MLQICQRVKRLSSRFPAWLGAALPSLGICLATGLAFALPAKVKAQVKSEDDAINTGVYIAPADGGARRWRITAGSNLRLFGRPSEGAPVIATLSEAVVLSNLGCAKAADQFWCEVRPFRGGARGFARAERLVPAQGPDGTTPMGADDSKRRARKRDFDAKGEIPCAQERGQALGTCGAAVARSGGGDATVVATFANGFVRRLYFIHGEFVSASATMSGVGTDTDWRLEKGVHFIRVDDQRYELPNALVFGD